MKLMIYFSLFIIGVYAQAGGYDCRSACLAIDSENKLAVVLESVHQRGDLSRNEVFESAQDQCDQFKNRAGYVTAAAILPRHYAIHSSDEHWTATHADSSVFIGWRFVLANGNVDSQSFNHKTLDVEITENSAQFACHYDSAIKNNSTPDYVGDEVYLP